MPSRSHPVARALGLAAACALLLAGVAGSSLADAARKPTYRPGLPLEFRSGNGTAIGTCTSGFALHTRRGWRGLTAGSCPPNESRGTRVWLDGVRVGRVGRVAHVPPDGPNWATVRLDGVSVRQRIRPGGNRAPVDVSGWVPTDKQEPGTRVCGLGAASKRQRCGRITALPQLSESEQAARHVRCTSASLRPGDGGGPVYLRPRSGRTRAVGIVTFGVARPSNGAPGTNGATMCYQPIEAVLDHFPRASLAR